MPVYHVRLDWLPLPLIQPSQLSCLGTAQCIRSGVRVESHLSSSFFSQYSMEKEMFRQVQVSCITLLLFMWVYITVYIKQLIIIFMSFFILLFHYICMSLPLQMWHTHTHTAVTLSYPAGSLAAEIILLLILAVLDATRIFLGMTSRPLILLLRVYI